MVRALTGTDPDRLAEEQRRGLTIELGFAWCELPPSPDGTRQTAAFVDVPGHERFIGTMLAGAGPAPAALLVVAADDGWSAQTEEHVEVLDLLGVHGLAVAVTKTDTVPAERTDEVVADVTGRLAGTSLEGAPVVRTAAPDRVGIDELERVLADRFALRPAPTDHGRPRLWVDRVFPVRGAGTVVTGTLAGGVVRAGDALRVFPGDHDVRVRGIQTLGRDVEIAAPGTRVALNLVGIDRDGISRGDAVVGGGPWRSTTRLNAVVRALPGRTVDRAGAWVVHAGSASVPARVLPLTDPIVGERTGRGGAWSTTALAKDAGADDGPTYLANVGAVRLLLDAPLPLVAGDRLVLRESGRRETTAGGQVVDPDPGPPPRGRAAREAQVLALGRIAAAEGPAGRLAALLELHGGVLPGTAALAAAGVPTGGPRPAGILAVGGHAVLESVWLGWTETVVAAAGGDSTTRERLTVAAAAAGAPPDVAAELPDRLVTDGQLVRTPTGFAVAGAEVTDTRSALDEQLLAALRAEPFSPPDLTATAKALGIDHRGVNRLVQAGAIVRAGKVAFAADAVTRAVDLLEDLEAATGAFAAAQAKDAWGTTRRYAIPLLEHLDRTRVTDFDGQLRTLTDRRPTSPA
ncbi:MAG: SelB C-terminal domain-containing protein [Egicoccus sp.]